MRRIVKFLNNFFARLTAVFVFLLTLFSALCQYGIIKNISFTPKTFSIIAAASFIIALAIAWILKKYQIPNKDYNSLISTERKSSKNTENLIIEQMNNRIGSSRSLIKYKDMIDNKHKYLSISRYDVLDYTSANYQSIRIFHGTNVSHSTSTDLPYCESTEYKISFNEITVEAYDILSGKKLKVECANNSPNEKLCTHRFRINFERPLQPNESFHILCYISFPHELSCLSQDKEIMSISLVRIKKKPVNNLSFSVLLNYEPSLVRFFSYNANSDKAKTLHTNEVVKKESIENCLTGINKNILSLLPINIKQEFYTIGINISKAKESIYLIEYQQ